MELSDAEYQARQHIDSVRDAEGSKDDRCEALERLVEHIEECLQDIGDED